MKTTAQIVTRLIAKHFRIPDAAISAETRIVSDLHADSLDSLELVMAFEDHFEIEISDADAAKCSTVRDCVVLMERLLQKDIATQTR